MPQNYKKNSASQPTAYFQECGEDAGAGELEDLEISSYTTDSECYLSDSIDSECYLSEPSYFCSPEDLIHL
jgi:hypothetical protein